MTVAIKLGPVLSFRGAVPAGGHTDWRVSALVGIHNTDAAPALLLDDRPCAAPLLLLEHDKIRYFRYDLSVPTGAEERRVRYGFGADGPHWEFTVPSNHIAPRIAYVSCNGFSDPSGMRKLVRPANAVWDDLLCNHDRVQRQAAHPSGYLLDKEQIWHEKRIHDQGLQRFHLLLMGGDQIYFDSIWEELPELKQWVSLAREQQLDFKVSRTLAQRIDNYYLGLYSQRWLPPKRGDWQKTRGELDSADAMASIPAVMMWDDHDIFDGWGSYSPQMQQCALFRVLFHSARRAFWVFQMQHALDALPPLAPVGRAGVSQDDPQFEPIDWSAHRRADPLALPMLARQPGFSYAFDIGPLALVVADLRTERSGRQILGDATWGALKEWLARIPARCGHLLFMSSVPVAHPKLSLIENGLDILGQDNVVDSNADDLKDHWAHDDHEGERKRLVETLACTALEKSLRVAIVSGDVHVAAWGTIYRTDAAPGSNISKLQQFTSSAVLHPSLSGVFEKLFLSFLNNAASRVQQIDIEHNVEMMLFPGHNQYVFAARNWLALETDTAGDGGAKLWATWRCENKSGFSNHLHAVHPAVAG